MDNDTDTDIYYRATTADLRPPIQGGPPLWDGSCPHTLPRVEVDEGYSYCAPGWHACARLEDAIRIAGEWPDGRPSRLWHVVPVAGCPVLDRGAKSRAASWTVISEVSQAEARAARMRLYSPMAGEGLAVEELVDEVEAWRSALARPGHDAAAVEAGLRAALAARGLEAWTLRQYDHASAALAARDAWDSWAACAARGALADSTARDDGAALAARDAWDSWAPRDARAVLDALAAWNASAAWAAWVARDAWDGRAVLDAWDCRATFAAKVARAALTILVAARRGWTRQRPDLLTVGLRGAYAAGLALALPTGATELGWAMDHA